MISIHNYDHIVVRRIDSSVFRRWRATSARSLSRLQQAHTTSRGHERDCRSSVWSLIHSAHQREREKSNNDVQRVVTVGELIITHSDWCQKGRKKTEKRQTHTQADLPSHTAYVHDIRTINMHHTSLFTVTYALTWHTSTSCVIFFYLSLSLNIRTHIYTA